MQDNEKKIRETIESVLKDFDEYREAAPEGFIEEIIKSVKANPLDAMVREKTEDVDPVIVNITEERFIHTMNILESVANKTISVPVDSILIENNKEKLLVETICEMQKSVVFAMETLSSFSA